MRALMLAAALLAPSSDPGGDPGLHKAVFTKPAPLASAPEMARRLLSPLTAAQIPALLARSGKTLDAQSIDVTKEAFSVYVPARPGPAGYGLLVFIAPWPQAQMPPGWAAVLERAGVIFVTAAGSGNDASVLTRRVPLALTAAQNAMLRYPIDAKRVFIGGFSGGSRVALRLALGYPDLFRGALLNAGSDPIGDATIPVPPRELMQRFQASSRIVYVTGARDVTAQGGDQASLTSLRGWCVFDAQVQTMAWAGHEVASPAALALALRTLDEPAPAPGDRLAACRSRIDSEIDAALARVSALIRAGQGATAGKQLIAIDRRFGGLAAPRSLELAK